MQSDNVDSHLMGLGVDRASNLNQYLDVGAEIGGPIIEDKLWWWAGHRHQVVQKFVTGTQNPDGSFPIDETVLWYPSAKINWAINQNHNFSVYFNMAQKKAVQSLAELAASAVDHLEPAGGAHRAALHLPGRLDPEPERAGRLQGQRDGPGLRVARATRGGRPEHARRGWTSPPDSGRTPLPSNSESTRTSGTWRPRCPGTAPTGAGTTTSRPASRSGRSAPSETRAAAWPATPIPPTTASISSRASRRK